MKTGAVIVAAGMSTRMRQFKQLMKIGEMSMAERVIVNFQCAGVKDIVVVVGYRAGEVEKELHGYGITFIKNMNYRTTEMFDSAKLGLEYLENRCDRILFCPADVPVFTENTVKSLLQRNEDLVIPVYQEKPGHPILINCTLISDILKYQGGGGLRGAIDFLGAEAARISVDDEGAVMDADTKEDYTRLVKLHNKKLMRTKAEVFSKSSDVGMKTG